MALLALLVILLVAFLLITAHKNSKPTALNCTVTHVDKDESYVSWYDQYSKLHQETDGCSDCIYSRAEQLQAQGMKVWKVELGRRNTGQL
ncbi:MAG TPA: hypothetical protein VEL31_16055 [Ktedonobacteraceae bacterium]|nr:hypothetical protein [Ktedonobacteraceae bacterium]